MASYAKTPFWSLFKYDDAFYLWILGDCTRFCISFAIYLYIFISISLGFLSVCYLDFMLFLRCDCSHVALFICLLPVPIFVARRNIRARHRNMFRRGGAGRDGGGARLRDEYLQRAGTWFFLAFSFPRIFVACFAHRARPPDFSSAALRASRSLLWDSALFTVHKALIHGARRLRLAALGDDTRSSWRTAGDLQGAFNSCLFTCSRRDGRRSLEEGKPSYEAAHRRRRVVAALGHFAWQNG